MEGRVRCGYALRWNKGDFWLDKKSIPKDDTIDCSVMALLLEGMRRIDEGISPTGAFAADSIDEKIDLDGL